MIRSQRPRRYSQASGRVPRQHDFFPETAIREGRDWQDRSSASCAASSRAIPAVGRAPSWRLILRPSTFSDAGPGLCSSARDIERCVALDRLDSIVPASRQRVPVGGDSGRNGCHREASGGRCRHGPLAPDCAPEDRVIRLIFEWIGLERLSSRAVYRRLQGAGLCARSGRPRRWAPSLHGMVANLAYRGMAMYGRFHAIEPHSRLGAIRHHPLRSARPRTRVPAPRSERVPGPRAGGGGS